MAERSHSPQPELQDRALEGLAEMFRGDPEDPTPGAALLRSDRLDFSVESLAVVDDHLETMRAEELTGTARHKFVLRCGAYVGEVIRRHSPASRKWHWLKYQDAVQIEARLAQIGFGPSTLAVLWDSKKEFCFPLGKVVKFLENGPEDSVKFFAEFFIAGPPKEYWEGRIRPGGPQGRPSS